MGVAINCRGNAEKRVVRHKESKQLVLESERVLIRERKEREKQMASRQETKVSTGGRIKNSILFEGGQEGGNDVCH